jgi:hypothetical protein
MLCGEENQTYSPKVMVGTDGGNPVGGEAPTPTDSIRPTGNPYPPNCSGGTTPGGPTPTPNQYGDTPQGSGGGRGSGVAECTCSVIASCQEDIRSSPDSTQCSDADCSFNVENDYPTYSPSGVVVTFNPEESGEYQYGTFSFNDNSTPRSIDDLDDDPSSVDHTYYNAGQYMVTLQCSETEGGQTMSSCSKTLNVYCNNGVAPTSTTAPTNSPTPTPTPGAWFKIKNGSFHSDRDIYNPIPETVEAYDDDDSGMCDDSGSIRCLEMKTH